MAKQNFLAGGYVGKLGATVGQRWRNIRTLRTYVIPRNPDTDAQRANRGRFAGAIAAAQAAIVFNKGAPCWEQERLPEFQWRTSVAKNRLDAGLQGFAVLPLFPDTHQPSQVITQVQAEKGAAGKYSLYFPVGYAKGVERAAIVNITMLAQDGEYKSYRYYGTFLASDGADMVIQTTEGEQIGAESAIFGITTDDREHDGATIYIPEQGIEEVSNTLDVNDLAFSAYDGDAAVFTSAALAGFAQDFQANVTATVWNDYTQESEERTFTARYDSADSGKLSVSCPVPYCWLSGQKIAGGEVTTQVQGITVLIGEGVPCASDNDRQIDLPAVPTMTAAMKSVATSTGGTLSVPASFNVSCESLPFKPVSYSVAFRNLAGYESGAWTYADRTQDTGMRAAASGGSYSVDFSTGIATGADDQLVQFSQFWVQCVINLAGTHISCREGTGYFDGLSTNAVAMKSGTASWEPTITTVDAAAFDSYTANGLVLSFAQLVLADYTLKISATLNVYNAAGAAQAALSQVMTLAPSDAGKATLSVAAPYVIRADSTLTGAVLSGVVLGRFMVLAQSMTLSAATQKRTFAFRDYAQVYVSWIDGEQPDPDDDPDYYIPTLSDLRLRVQNFPMPFANVTLSMRLAGASWDSGATFDWTGGARTLTTGAGARSGTAYAATGALVSSGTEVDDPPYSNVEDWALLFDSVAVQSDYWQFADVAGQKFAFSMTGTDSTDPDTPYSKYNRWLDWNGYNPWA